MEAQQKYFNKASREGKSHPSPGPFPISAAALPQSYFHVNKLLM